MSEFLKIVSVAVAENSVPRLNEAVLKLNDSNIWADYRDILREVSVIVDAFLRLKYTGEQIRNLTKEYREPLPEYIDSYLKRNPKVDVDIRGMGYKFENGNYCSYF